MAYVAISAELREAVMNNIKGMKVRELNAAPAHETSLRVPGHQITPLYYEMLWGEHNHLRTMIPSSWGRKISTVYAKCTREITDEANAGTAIATITLEFPDGIFGPPQSDSYPRRNVGEDFLNMKELLDAAVVRHEINMRWQRISEQVTSFIRSSKSLNEAVKLWPDVRLYIPPQYLTRLDTKVAKSTTSRAAEVLKQIDTDSATAAVVGLRFVEAAKVQS